ncbi:S-adenosyl-L-methionine-dependent methyltransferase [Amylocystis lapponica]|nr:S-adenosyl-L-methionine-dependent methyltransferase [Amylocystis lapponica]
MIDAQADYSDHSDAGSDSASSGIVEMEPADFPASFREWGGRLFHSHGPSPYPLPVDAAEQHRLNRQHGMLHNIVNSFCVGPVDEVLVNLPGPRRHVVDLGTGTGRWVLDMARNFPHVDFHGYDIAPIQTRRPPNNVWFVMFDITERLSLHEDHTVDLVHARDVALGLTNNNYMRVLRESGRILRRGGLLVLCEWSRFPFVADGGNLSFGAPHTHALFSAIDQVLVVRCGLHDVAHNVAQWVRDTGHFDNIESLVYRVPIGGTHHDPNARRRVEIFREMMSVFVNSIRWLLLRTGYSEANIDMLRDNCLRELEMTPGIEFRYHTIHARRR